MKHGDTTGIIEYVWMGPDPDLALVDADLGDWSLAHPCDCEALCTCEETE